MVFTDEELATGRLTAFTQIPQGARRSGAPFPRNYPEQDFDAICLHRPEMTAPRIFNAKRTAKFFSKMSSPYHIWLCGPDATRQRYTKKLAGSYVRDPDAALTDGYTAAFQRVALTACAWALKNDNGGEPIVCTDGQTRKMQTNRRGRLIQITLAGWSADSSFTTEEDFLFYSYYIARVGLWLELTNPNRTPFRWEPWQRTGNIGVAKMPDGLWMSPDSKRLMDHGAVPSGNKHWDIGPMDFAHLSELCAAEYDKLKADLTPSEHTPQPPPAPAAPENQLPAAPEPRSPQQQGLGRTQIIKGIKLIEEGIKRL